MDGKLLFSHGQNFCPGQEIFFPRQNHSVYDKSDFVPDKKYFVQADGQGIIFTQYCFYDAE